MKLITYGRIKNYPQWFFKIGIFYFEYSAAQIFGIGFEIDPRLYVDIGGGVKVIHPCLYVSLFMGPLGCLDFSINNINF